MIDKKEDFYRIFFVLACLAFKTVECSGNNTTTASDRITISLHRDKVNHFGYASFVKHINTSLNVNVALKGFLRRAGECAFVCANSSIGFSFNFAINPDIHGRHVCEILATDKYNASDKFITKIGFNHYSLYSPCSSFPCMNGATCHAKYEQGTYECLCMPGFGGKFCQNEINECASNPCFNGGVCTDMFAAYKCTCHPGFSGDRCEIVSPGALVPGGFQVCARTISYAFAYMESYHVTRGQYYTYKCGLWGWGWARCKGWRRIYSKAYRTAYRLSYRIAYKCCPGFINAPNTGECFINIDECASTPCQNSGTCIDKVNGYECNCTAGFSGSQCQINIDECSSSPCLNGGSCVDQVNGYMCACAAGYTGVHCETEINECSSNPCLYGATCHDQVNGYTCTCAGGYTGTNCQTNINECLSNPCQNYGACNDLMNGYSCTCQPNYTGTNCEIEV